MSTIRTNRFQTLAGDNYSSIVQVQSSFIRTGVSLTTTAWTSVGLSVTLTPRFATSRVLVDMRSACAYHTGLAVTELKFVRAGAGADTDSPLSTGIAAGQMTMGVYSNGGSGNNNGIPISMIWYDLPAVTTPITYSVFMRGNGTAQIRFGTSAEGNTGNYDVVSTILAMEIAQ
jgi:hypothetical protein